MPFSSIFGHEKVIQSLCDAASRDHLPTAYLFSGPTGVGKGVVALAMAQMLNCDTKNNCGRCPSCQMFAKGGHPDIILIRPQGKFIRIAQIQELIQALSLKPVYAKKRVVILKHVQEMNVESANAFLKILEEPPLDSLFILTVQDASALLETIRSRCAQVAFAPLAETQIMKILEAKFRLPEDCKSLGLAYSHGRLRREFIEKAPKLLSLRAQALHILSNLEDAAMEGHLHQLEALLKQNLEFYFLEFVGSLLKDFILLQLGQLDRVTNQDLLAELQGVSNKFHGDALEKAFSAVLHAEEQLLSFAGKSLALEACLVRLKQSLA